jgi:hypothetical protein
LINQQYEEQQSHSAGDHPNAFVNRIAHSIGFYAARTYLRIQDITHITHKETHQQDQEKARQTESPDKPAQRSEQATALPEEQNKPVTIKAEEKLDNLVQHLSSFTTTLKFNFQRTTARTREGAEDIWAEAQNIRHHQKDLLPH